MRRDTESRTGRSRRSIGILFGAALGAALLGGEGAEAQQRSVLRYVPSSEPKVFDPLVNPLAVTHQHAYMIFDTLFALDAEGRPQPQMVERVERSADGTAWTMTLREGLLFHDGSPVRAADAVASIRRWAAREPTGRKLAEIGLNLAIVDERRFEIRMPVATPLLIEALAKPSASAMFVLREADAQTDPATPVGTNIGSGPFRWVASEYRAGDRLVYERNLAYRPRAEPASGYAGGKVAGVDRVEWVIMPDAATSVTALQGGEVDIVESPPLDLIPVLERSRNIAVRVQSRTGANGILRPNHLHPPFNRVEARRALALLVDQPDYMRVAAGNDERFWRRCFSFLGCGGQNEDQSGTEWMRAPDIERARALLREAGYNGETLTVIGPGDNQIIRDFTVLTAERLRAAGVRVDLQLSDFGAVIARRARKDPPSQGGWNIVHTWGFGFELDNPVGNYTLSAPCGDPAWPGWACDPELERLRDAWAREGDPDRRRALIAQIQRQAATTVPVVPLGQFFAPVAYRRNLEGFLEAPLPVMWNVRKPQAG